MAVHPANAVFVSGDGKVSFNENGRKLDSNGNVVWGDYQGLRGARARVRPEIIQAYEEEEKQRLAQQQAQQQAPAATYRPPSADVMGQRPPQPQPPAWGGVGEWNRFSPGGQPPQPPRYDPLSSAPAPDWNRFTPPTPAWQPPPSGLGGAPVMGESSNAPLPPALVRLMGQQPEPPRYDPLSSAPGNWNRFRR